MSALTTSGVKSEPSELKDPFLNEEWKYKLRPWTTIPEGVISSVVGPECDEESLKPLVSADFQGIVTKSARLPVIESVKLDEKYIKNRRLDTDGHQHEVYCENPAKPNPFPRTILSLEEVEENYAVPCFEYMPNTPVMLAKAVHEYIRTNPVSDGPGCSTKFPLC